MVASYGETLTLRREGSPNTDVSVKGRIAGASPDQLVGDLRQSSRNVVIGNDEIVAAAWPGPPRKGDRLIFADGKVVTIMEVDTRKLKDAVAGHWLTIKG